jgi:hypothetical protein
MLRSPFHLFVACTVALSAALACSGPIPEPDEREGNNSVYWHGNKPLPHMMDALRIMEQHGLDECTSAGRPNAFTWCSEVHWHPAVFDCGGVPVEGCQPNQPTCAVDVVWHERISEAALADELGHFVWEMCHGRSGEHVPGTDIRIRVYEPEYAAWIQAVNEDIAVHLEQP